MRRWPNLALLTAFLLAAVVAAPNPARATDTGASCIDADEAAAVALINEYRAANGIGPVWATQTLSAASEHHSVSMATNGYFSHNLIPEGIGWAQNMTNHGYTYTTWRGENLAGGQTSAAQAVVEWQNSPGHNAVMLNPDFNAIGIGLVYNAASIHGWYWSTNFGGHVDAPATLCGGGTMPAPVATTTTPAVAAVTSEPDELPIVAGGRSGNSSAPTAAYDGDPATVWKTTRTTVNSAYVWFDLGAVRDLRSVEWVFSRTGAADAMRVEVSRDKTSWTTLATPGNAPAGEWQAAPAETTARYIRLDFANPNRDAKLGFLAEVKILG